MRSLKEVTRYEDLAFYEWKALATKLGGLDNVLAVIQGEKAVKIEELIKLFDKNGRRIPSKDLQSNVCDPDKSYRLNQPEFKTMDNFAQRLLRFQQAFSGPMSVAEFEGKTKELVSEIRSNKLLVNLLNGVYLSIILPQIEAKNFDYGMTLEKFFLSAVKKAYEAQFPGRNFYNYREGELANKVNIVEGSRHEILLERMKQRIVYALYFPNPLQGFSNLASCEQMKDLPESLILSGGFDTSAAMVMYPDVLVRDFKTPGYDLAALRWQSFGCSLCFRAHDDGLRFNDGASLGSAGGYYSSGLLFLGSA